MNDDRAATGARFTIGAWNDDGIASLEASGADSRAALEAGLRATLALAVGPMPDAESLDAGQLAPIRGEGNDLGELFADLVEDLLAQLEDFGSALRDVRVDGVLRRDRGGYVAWGYAATTGEPEARMAVPRLLGAPKVDAAAGIIVIRASLIRG